jgi:hypothetical protein
MLAGALLCAASLTTGLASGVDVDGFWFMTLNASASAPAAPTLVSPANGASGVAQPLTLDWNDVSNATSYEVQVDTSSTIAAPFTANPTVTTSEVTLSAVPAQPLWWRVRARNAEGLFGPFSSTRRFTPQPASAPALSSVTLSPTSVTSGARSTGTVTLASAAPPRGAVVSLSSSNTTIATVPASVTVASGATSATFSATAAAVGVATPVTVAAVYGGVTRTATLTVNPAQTATLTVTATGRTGERVMSSPGGINVNVGGRASAAFTTGTAITLSATNGRDAIWSGACSSGGDRKKTCTFTLKGNVAVTADVQ